MIEKLDFRKIYQDKQDFPNPPIKGCPDDLSVIEFIVENKINEIITVVNGLEVWIKASSEWHKGLSDERMKGVGG